jgi:ankyrin repeat protein
MVMIGNTPLHTAYHTTHSNIAQLLIASGANQNKANASGLTPAQLGK